MATDPDAATPPEREPDHRGQPLRTLDVVLEPDPARTVIRPFEVGYPDGMADGRPPRPLVVARRVLALPRAKAEELGRHLLEPMVARHRNAREVFERRYEELGEDVRALPADASQRLLLGAVFSQEYAFESAALFNPSIIPDSEREGPDSEREGPDSEREKPDGESQGPGTGFLLSLRGVGEGHISSVTFRTGLWHADGSVEVDAPSPQAIPPRIVRHLDHTPGSAGGSDAGDSPDENADENADGVELICEDSADISETVIFPVLPSQRQGIEDLRMVVFTDDDGSREVIGTYTAFDGRQARAEILHGVDFRTVEMRSLSGRMARYKGMALFPRRIDGRFVMLGRQDNERIWLLTSQDLYRWDEGRPIMAPRYPWEWVQIGNCGSPLEIDEGWLVLTHGVGLVRSYCIGACLLDKADPSKVLARTPEPLLMPTDEHRGGYVPNVVYGCGMLARGRELLIPYAIGDRFATFATGTVDAILAAMVPED